LLTHNLWKLDFTDFAGNLSNPNTLFARAINNLHQRTGKHPDIRPGGITADSAWFAEDAPAIVRDLSVVSLYIRHGQLQMTDGVCTEWWDL
jgi:hypothetical protein